MNLTQKDLDAILQRDGYAIIGRDAPAAPDPAAPASRAHKYGARATVIDGVTFASQKEAREYQALVTLERMGLISDLRLQPRYELQAAFDRDGVHHRAIVYVGDFAFVRDGRQVVVDAKGFQTAVFRLKQKLFLAKYPDIVMEVR